MSMDEAVQPTFTTVSPSCRTERKENERLGRAVRANRQLKQANNFGKGHREETTVIVLQMPMKSQTRKP